MSSTPGPQRTESKRTAKQMAAKSTEREKVDFDEDIAKDYAGPVTFEQRLRHMQLKSEYGLIKIYTFGVLTIIGVLLALWIIGNSGSLFSNDFSQKVVLAIGSEAQIALVERAQKLSAAMQENYLNQISRIASFLLTPLLSILTLLIGYVLGRKNADTTHVHDPSSE